MLAVGLARYVGHLVPLGPGGSRRGGRGRSSSLAAVNTLGASLGSRVLGTLARLKIGLLGFLVIWGFGLGRGRLVEPDAVLVAAAGIGSVLPGPGDRLDRGIHLVRGLVGRQQDRRRSA